MKLKLDIKLMIGILTIAAALGGFYYTTQMRLDRLEAAIEQKQPSQELQVLKYIAGNLIVLMPLVTIIF